MEHSSVGARALDLGSNDGDGDGDGDGVSDGHDLLDDDSLRDPPTRDDLALLSFPEIQNRSHEEPPRAQAMAHDEAGVQAAIYDGARTQAEDHDDAKAQAMAVDQAQIDRPTQHLAASDQHRVFASQTHSDYVSSSPYSVSVSEGFPNKRLSWAERRSMRARLRASANSNSNSDSLTELAEELERDTTERGFQYEEFMKDSVPCPSCGGGGRIDRDTETKLVALIPYDDERLKPRRTWFYVGVAVAVSVLLALATLFFLFPRTVKMSSEKKRIQPLQIDIHSNISKPYVFLLLQNNFTVENSNFVPVTFESLTMRVTAFNIMINHTTNNTRVTIPLRSSETVYATAELFFKNALSFIVPYCADSRPYLHTFLFKFDIAAQASILGHSQDMSMSVFQYVSCGIDAISYERRTG